MADLAEATLLPLTGWDDNCPPLRFLRRLSERRNAMLTIWFGSMPPITGAGADEFEGKDGSAGLTWLSCDMSCDGLGPAEPADGPKVVPSTSAELRES